MVSMIFCGLGFNLKDKHKIIDEITYQTIKQYHYKKVVFNDSYSEKIFKNYLDVLDASKLFFLESDIRRFSKSKDKIDDYIRAKDFTFFEQTYQTLKKRQQQAKKIALQLLEQPFDFTKDEYISFVSDSIPYPKNRKELTDHWRRYLKYQVLIKLYNKYKRQQSDSTVEKKSFEELEAKAREEVKENTIAYFSRLEKLDEEDYFAMYINSFAMVDPHTYYLAPKQKEDFEISLGGELEGIGATLQQKTDKIKVVNVIVGGPAWKQGELENGDYILKVAQGDTGRWIDIVGMRLDEAVRLIRGPKGTKVRLMIEKPDGTIKEIEIIRDKIIIEESYVRSFILSDSTHEKKVGYMYIPSFYRNEDRSVAEDFIKELRKLDKENVDGIIIDLRNNGGGSLQDVVKMVGALIDYGPVVQVRNRKNKVFDMKDPVKGRVYDGEIIVMTNYFSASASEIFASAIQDYKRGIIFGTSHTHGKGTVQTILNYDDVVGIPKKYKPLGALSITIQKFYRVNGASTQLRGVIPDIIFSSQYQYIKIGEQEYENALEWDSIPAAKYFPYSYDFDFAQVRKNSLERMAKDSLFIFRNKFAKFLKQENKNKFLPLNFEKYRKHQDSISGFNKTIAKFNRQTNHLQISFTAADKKTMETDSAARIRFTGWAKRLKRDLILLEAYRIMQDIYAYK